MTGTVGRGATAPSDAGRAEGIVAIVAMTGLVLSGLFTAVFEVFYLPFYIGTGTLPVAEPEVMAAPAGLAASASDGAVPLPLTALLAAVLNVAFVAAMRTITDRVGTTLLPVLAWTVGFLACASIAPGGDLLLLADWPTLLLFTCGLAAPLLYTYRRTILAG